MARIAELSYEHMARDKYMDWHRLVRGLVGLCPSSSLAVLSRWRDREFGPAGELFPIAIYRLIDHRLLPRMAVVALSGTVSGWKRLNDVKAVIDAEADINRKRLMLGIAYRFLRIQTYEAATWRHLGTMHPTIGYADERIEIYLAQELTALESNALDEGEFLEVVTLSLDEALAQVRAGHLTDGKTLSALLWAEKVLREGW